MRGVEKGNIGPEKIGPIVVNHVGLAICNAEPKLTPYVRIAAGTRGGSTHSERIGLKLSQMLTHLLDRLDPEIQRGILHYTRGDEKQHGMAVLGLELLDEPSGVEIAMNLTKWVGEKLESLNAKDLETRNLVTKLEEGPRRFCLCSLRMAESYLEEGDDRSAMMMFAQIRKIVAKFSPRPETELAGSAG